MNDSVNQDLVAAGSWQWWEVFALIELWLAFALEITVFLSRYDPALLVERLKASPVQVGQKAWGKVLMLLVFYRGPPEYAKQTRYRLMPGVW